MVVVSDDIEKYDGHQGHVPGRHRRSTTAPSSTPCSARLREMPGVTVLIYEQTCAAEKRRRRKKGELADPDKRLFINEAVCEGCGDCAVQSELPGGRCRHETDLGRKRKIDQRQLQQGLLLRERLLPELRRRQRRASCKKQPARLSAGKDAFAAARRRRCQPPAAHGWTRALRPAGHRRRRHRRRDGGRADRDGRAPRRQVSAAVLDFTGFAQKGGAVLSLRAPAPTRTERLNQVRIDTAAGRRAAGLRRGGRRLGRMRCRPCGTAAPASLRTCTRSRWPSRCATPTPTSRSRCCSRRCASSPVSDQVQTFDAQTLAEEFLGDTLASNILAAGYAWQCGLIPLSLEALTRAIELNGVAVASNSMAFSLGRLAAGDPRAIDGAPRRARGGARERIARHTGGARHAASGGLPERRPGPGASRPGCCRCASAKPPWPAATPSLPVTRNAAQSLLKLMSYKDEYEVARLLQRRQLPREARRTVRGRPEARIPHGAALPREAPERPAAGQDPARRLDAAGDEVAGARQGTCGARPSTCSATPRSAAWSAS